MLFKLLCTGNRYTDNGTLCTTCTVCSHKGQDQKFHIVFIKIPPPQTLILMVHLLYNI